MRIVSACLFAVLFVGGCAHEAPPPVAARPLPPPPERIEPPAVVAAPRVAVSSVNLGDWCPEAPSQAASAEMTGTRLMADADYGTSHCQIALTVDALPTTRFQVVSATLLDENGQPLQELGVTAPQIWNGEAYVPWAGQLDEDGSANLLYALSRIDWSRIPDSYSRPLRVSLVVEIDGAASRVVSPETIREAMIVT